MSIREQERRQKEAAKRIEGEMRRADRQVRGSMEARAREAEKRAGEVVRRIEKGDVQPRPLPNLREDSMASMESMRSIESAETVSEVTGEANAQGMQEGMPLEGIMPYDPQGAGEDLAQRVTEESGAGGDPHAHNEQKADEIAADMTEDTGAGGDMNLDAERRVEGMGQRMFED